MLSHFLVFLVGLFLAPVVRPALRPLFVHVVRTVLHLIDDVRRLAVEAREGIEDAAAEAAAARDRAPRSRSTMFTGKTDPISGGPPS
ncbi:MAG: hypothetical protein AAGE94_07315 [Acidobacteriota bacterium]